MIADVPASVILPLLGGLLGILGSVPAVLAVWHGGDRPSWVSWAVWTATTALGTATSIAAGSLVAAVVPAAAFVRCAALLAVTLRSIRRYPTGRAATTRLEWTCLGLCGVAAAVWQLTGSATLGLLAAIGTDALASIPTWPLAWARKESALLWAGAAASPALTLLVLRGDTIADWAYPVYELALCGGMLLLTAAPRWLALLAAGAAAGAGLGAVGALTGLSFTAIAVGVAVPAAAIAAAPWVLDTLRTRRAVRLNMDAPTVSLHLPPPAPPHLPGSYPTYLQATMSGRTRP